MPRNGAPGLISAHYAGVHGDARRNIARVLDEMRDVPEAARTARFYSVVVLLRHAHDPQPIIAEGVIEGRILSSADWHKWLRLPAQFCPGVERECRFRDSFRALAPRQPLLPRAHGIARAGRSAEHVACCATACALHPHSVVREKVPVLRFQFARTTRREGP